METAVKTPVKPRVPKAKTDVVLKPNSVLKDGDKTVGFVFDKVQDSSNVKGIAIKVAVGAVVAVGIWQGVKFFKNRKKENA